MQILSVLLLALMFVPVLASLSFMPYLTRETVSFGVSVSEETYRSEPLRRMRKAYALTSLGIYTVLFLLCIFNTVDSKESLAQNDAIGIYISIMVAVSIALNLIFHFKMKNLRASLPSAPTVKSVLAVDTGFRRNKLILSHYWFLIHGTVIVASMLLVLLNYEKLPATIALKFDFQGHIVNSATKSYWTVLFPNVTQIVMTLLFLFINWSILRSKQQTYAGDPERSIRQNTLFRRRWSLYTILTGFAMVLLFSFIQLNMLYPMDTDVMLFVSILIPVFVVLFAVILAFNTGQGGSRIGRSKTGPGSNVKPVNDDDNWKLGSIYFNPQDPSIFVEKRSGIGWTMNFAHPAGWIILGGILIAVVASLIFSV
ncbi:putative membrane protein [Fontibacillus phaseoli]|uniref:Putative membrane protein n=1 Tax=Fontibacillus phaseoli TaxID=1416533 RepID=A0A369B3V3_9BACL|nr:DUF5808 domain-containing protein [Fontibacillus phaseoli]RCX16219.1 putative membrane protein [Fontibacillus phaseoli]